MHCKLVIIQIGEAETDEQLKLVFDQEPEQSLVYDTGYNKAMCLITLNDNKCLKTALRDHYSVIKIKAEVDQFIEGLRTLDVLDCIKKCPALMRQLFCYQPRN